MIHNNGKVREELLQVFVVMYLLIQDRLYTSPLQQLFISANNQTKQFPYLQKYGVCFLKFLVSMAFVSCHSLFRLFKKDTGGQEKMQKWAAKLIGGYIRNSFPVREAFTEALTMMYRVVKADRQPFISLSPEPEIIISLVFSYSGISLIEQSWTFVRVNMHGKRHHKLKASCQHWQKLFLEAFSPT